MSAIFRYGRHHWQALLVVAFLAWRLAREGFRGNALLWICVGLVVLGMGLNLVVVLVNGGMPAAVREDEIEESDRPHYRPIDDSTRLRFFSDWIPLGNLMISPGDVLLLIAVGILVFRAILGVNA